MPLSTQSATADLTKHPIVETFTQAGWTLNQEESAPNLWLTFDRKTKSGVLVEIQYLLDLELAGIFIKGSDEGSEHFTVETALEEATAAVEDNILFGGWA